MRDRSQGYWVIRTYTAGRVKEKTKYFVHPSMARNKKKAEQSVKKLEQNESNRARLVARLLNENCTPRDYLLTLNLNDETLGEITKRAMERFAGTEELTAEECVWIETEQEARLLLKRARREAGRQGGSLKAIVITSDMDGDTKEAVRPHLHVVCDPFTAAILEKKWEGRGKADKKHLYNQEDYTGLAGYLIRQVRHIKNRKSYIPTKTMTVRPPQDRIVYTGAELKVPRGAKLLHRGEYNGLCGVQYIRYLEVKTG